MYRDGQGVPKDEQQAVSWYLKATEQGLAIAQNNLGFMYANGQGAPKDEQQAVDLYRKAAEQGFAIAQNNLGFMYGKGRGVPKDEQQAVAWYRKAAEQGLATAQYSLGVMHANGQGVPKDEQSAYFWWLLASAQGEQNAVKNRDLLESRLSPEQRAAAQATARNWKPKTVAQKDASAQNKPDTVVASSGVDNFVGYFIQTGVFRMPEDAEQQRAKLSLMGYQAKVTEHEQSGKTVYRVRLGPFGKKDDADKIKEKLDSNAIETALVRVQR